MAYLSGRHPERRLSPRAAVIALLVSLAGPGSLRAQQGPPAPAGGTSLTVEGGVGLSGVRGKTVGMGGGTVLLTLDSRFAFGLAGWRMLSDLSVAGSGGSLDFSFAYGGAVGELTLARPGALRLSTRILVGAGNGKLSLPVVGTELLADNFGVFEPELDASVGLAGPVRVSAAVGYRTVWGVQDLLEVSDSDLRGWSTRLSLRLQLF